MCSRMLWGISEKKATAPLLGIAGALKATFSAKTCFEKMQWSMSGTVNSRAFKPLSLCSAPLKTY